MASISAADYLQPIDLRLVQFGRTGLVQAANTGQIEVVRLLLEKRAHVDAADKVPPPPPNTSPASVSPPPRLQPRRHLTSAPRTASIPRARQNDSTGLLLASQNGHHDVVQLLLDTKADPNLASEVHPPPPRPPSTQWYRPRPTHPHPARARPRRPASRWTAGAPRLLCPASRRGLAPVPLQTLPSPRLPFQAAPAAFLGPDLWAR
jgi:ankyrin repeat protein